MKKCTKCGIEKELSEFGNKKASKDGKYCQCKVCTNAYDKLYYSKNVKKVSDKNKLYAKNNKDSIKKRKAEYKCENEELIKSRRLSRYQKHKVELSRKSREYYQANSKELNKKHVKRSVARRKVDTNFNLRCKLSSRVTGALKRNGSNKSTSTINLINCSIDDLKTHLQKTAEQNYPDKQFNINNYNGEDWHIDHIVPCSSFDLSIERQQRECFNWENLQILTSEDNLIKGAN